MLGQGTSEKDLWSKDERKRLENIHMQETNWKKHLVVKLLLFQVKSQVVWPQIFRRILKTVSGGMYEV